MEKFQFVGFEPTPGEKYLGVATVRIYGPIVIVLRYKIVAKKDGKGYFPGCASYKMPNRMPGEEYDECFMIDSRSDNDAIIKFIMHNFHIWNRNQGPSVFEPTVQHGQQTNANVGDNSQQGALPFMQRPEYQQAEAEVPF